MGSMVKYVFASLIGAGIVGLLSLVWPRFTAQTEPEALRIVRDNVLGTEIGKNTAHLLGVSDESIEPINLSDTVASVAGVVTSSVEQKVFQIVSDQVASQVIKQYQQLPIPQQERVVEIVCTQKE